jgi:hypothetical protein
MAPPHSSAKTTTTTAFSYRPTSQQPRWPYPEFDSSTSLLDDLRSLVAQCLRTLRRLWHQHGRGLAVAIAMSALRALRLNLSARRLFSFPHLLVVLWAVVLLWAERWVFHSKVDSCHWGNWENWVSYRPARTHT